MAKEYPSLSEMELAYVDFHRLVSLKIFDQAKEKGYGGNAEEKEQLRHFVDKHFPGHAEGEILYKLVRWGSQKDTADLIKIAAWAFIIWWMDKKKKEPLLSSSQMKKEDYEYAMGEALNLKNTVSPNQSDFLNDFKPEFIPGNQNPNIPHKFRQAIDPQYPRCTLCRKLKTAAIHNP